MKTTFFDDFITTVIYASFIPTILSILYATNIIFWSTFKLSLFAFFVIFFILPLVFKLSYKLQESVIFLNFANWPKNPDYANPPVYGLEGVRNFYLDTDDHVTLGVWQILPEDIVNTSEKTDHTFYESILNNGQPVVLYNHGNSGNRAAPHRVELYQVLRKHFHVIAYDYRGYGDSSEERPTEPSLVKDCMFMYKWIANKTTSKVFVWGHSLGTGLSLHFLALLKEEGIRPTGLVLESPFNNLRDEIREHPLASLFKNLPWFTYTVVDAMEANNIKFKSDQHILNVDCSILILHAKDDKVVPYKLGYKLYLTAMEKRQQYQGSVEFRGFEAKFGYGHKFICRAPELHEIIKKFIVKATEESESTHLKNGTNSIHNF